MRTFNAITPTTMHLLVITLTYLFATANAFPTENNESQPQSSEPESFIFNSVANSITDSVRTAVKATKNISDFMINGDTSRTRGFFSSLFSCFFSKELTRDQIILNITSTNDFNTNVKNSKIPVLVMYTFTGCKACETISPKLADYAVSLKGKILYAKVNTDNINVPDKNSLSSYPSIQMFKKDVQSERKGPSDAQNNYKSFVENFLKKNK